MRQRLVSGDGRLANATYPKVIWSRFNDFSTDLFERRVAKGIAPSDVAEDIERMSVSEYADCVISWIDDGNRKP